MSVVLSSRADLTLDVFERVAWRGEPVRLDDVALARIADARAAFELLLDDPELTIYGVTSGYGDRASIRLDEAGRREQARRGPGWLRLSFGEALPERIARGIVLARLSSIVEGHAAVRPVLARAVAAMLDGPLPPVPAHGHGGSGEIIPLGHLFAGLGRLELAEKETIALVNGSPCAAALIADAAVAAPRRLAIAEEVFALSVEAVAAPLEAYAPELEQLWDDEHETAALRRLRGLLDGGGAERRPYQAPVSYRILPRVLGQARRIVADAERAASSSLRAVGDNPVFFPDRPAGSSRTAATTTRGHRPRSTRSPVPGPTSAGSRSVTCSSSFTGCSARGAPSGRRRTWSPSATRRRPSGTPGVRRCRLPGRVRTT